MRRARWTEVRVFVSSTFRDMHAERDHLVKIVFPEIRERLEPHRMRLVDIDLRWGITREQADNNQALELCLQEIDRCRPEPGNRRPFFIAMLGERHGFVPAALPEGLTGRYPWLGDYAQHSITALEVVCGALLHPRVDGRCFFYFRDPSFAAAMPPLVRAIVEEDDETARQLQAGLRRRIREAGWRVGEDYSCRYAGMKVDLLLARHAMQEEERHALASLAIEGLVLPGTWDALTPALQASLTEYGTVVLDELTTFGERVRDDLWQAIVRQYPQVAERPSATHALPGLPEQEEDDAHDRFAESRLVAYVGRVEIHQSLLARLAGDRAEPLALVGAAGSGKSAIMARLYSECSQNETGPAVLAHFVGASAGSASVARMLQRLCVRLCEEFGLPRQKAGDGAQLSDAFSRLLWLVPAERSLLLLVDGLDELDEASGDSRLYWLPTALPENVKILVSCLQTEEEGAPLAELRRRGSPVVPVPPLRESECLELIRRLPSLSARTLDVAQRESLLANQATRNPLYLRVALEELAGFGRFEHVTARIAHFAAAPDAEALFGQMLERVEVDFGRALVKTLTCALATSRSGLSERELTGILGPTGAPGDLPAALRQLRQHLHRRGHLIDYYHRTLRSAVKARYDLDRDARSWHRRLAEAFASQPASHRQVAELSWQLSRAEDLPGLYAVLANPTFLQLAWAEDPFQVFAYWAQIEGGSDLRLVDAYAPVLADPASHSMAVLDAVADLLHCMGHSVETVALYDRLIDHHRRHRDLAGLMHCLGMKGVVMRDCGELERSAACFEEQEQVCEQTGDLVGLAQSWGDRAVVHYERGEIGQALLLYDRVERLCEQTGDTHVLTCCLGERALALAASGQPEQAMLLLARAERNWRARGHQRGLAKCLQNQGLRLRELGDLQGAAEKHREAEGLFRRLGDQNGLASSLVNQAVIRRDTGGLDEAEAQLREAEAIARRASALSPLLASLRNLSTIRLLRSDDDGALALAKEHLALAEAADARREVAIGYGNLGSCYAVSGDPGRALELYRQSERLSREINFAHGIQLALGGIAQVVAGRGETAAALALYEEQERICRQHRDPEGLAHALFGRASLIADAQELPAEALPDASPCRRAQLLLLQAEQWRRSGDRDGALRALREAKALCQPDQSAEARHMLQLVLGEHVRLYLEAGEFSEAHALTRERCQLCRHTDNRGGLQDALGQQALACAGLNDLAEFERALTEQETICRELGRVDWLCGSLREGAALLADLGLEAAARVLGQRLARTMGSPQDGPDTEADRLAREAAHAFAARKLDQAAAIHQRELQERRRQGDPHALQASLGRLGVVLKQLGRFEEAIEVLAEQQSICTELGDMDGLQRALANHGNVLATADRAKEAEEVYDRQESVCREHELHEGLVRCLYNRALLRLQHSGRPDAALAIIEQAGDLVRQHHLDHLAPHVQGLRAAAEKALRSQETPISTALASASGVRVVASRTPAQASPSPDQSAPPLGAEAATTLTSYPFLEARLRQVGVQRLISDIAQACAESVDLPVEARAVLKLVGAAVRLSPHVLARDPNQLASQLLGRIPPGEGALMEALRSAASSREAGPWLRPLSVSLASPLGPLQGTFAGHPDRVNGVAVAPDGSLAVTASSDRTLKLWDLGTGRERGTLVGHAAPVWAVTFTPDGRHIVSGSFDGTVRKWDAQTAAAELILQPSSGAATTPTRLDANHFPFTDVRQVSAVTVTPDGQTSLAAYADGSLKAWDLTSGDLLRTFSGHTDTATAVLVTGDGTRVLSASFDGAIRVWDLSTAQELAVIPAHHREIWDLALTPDDSCVISASLDRTLRVWRLATGQEELVLSGHTEAVTSVVVTPDGACALSGSEDHTIRLWDLSTGQETAQCREHEGAVLALALTADGTKVVSGGGVIFGGAGAVMLWYVDAIRRGAAGPPHSDSVWQVAIAADRSTAVAASFDRTVSVWDVAEAKQTASLSGHRDQAWCVAITPDGRQALSGARDGTIARWDLKSATASESWRGHRGAISALAIAPDGSLAASASSDNVFHCWDLTSDSDSPRLRGTLGTVWSIAFTPDGTRVVLGIGAGRASGGVLIVDLRQGQIAGQLVEQNSLLWDVAVTPDGRRLLTAALDASIRLWDLETGEMLGVLTGHEDEVRAVAVTPDGRYAVSGSKDHTVRLWDLETLSPMSVFTGEAWITTCAIAADGLTVMAGENSGRIHFLSLARLTPGPAVVTAVRLWRTDRRQRDEELTVLCGGCCRRSPVSAEQLGEPFSCPECGRRLILNSFVCDSSQ